ILLIAAKDLRLAFRDRAAIILMLAAPFLLTLGMALVTGRLASPAGQSSGLSNIPVLVINRDGESLGNALVDTLQSAELDELLDARVVEDEEAARRAVDEDQVAGLVIIPAGFTQSVIPAQGGAIDIAAEPVKIQFYANPARPNSSAIIETILREFISRVEEGRVMGMVSVFQMLTSGALSPAEAQAYGDEMRQLFQSAQDEELSAFEETSTLNLKVVGAPEQESVRFDVMAYMAPGMALLFLMFTVTYGGRSFLAERRQRTLQRMLTTPTGIAQVLAGKMFGTYLSGVLQLVVLIGGSSLLFNLRWGDFWGVAALILLATFAATGWGMLITAFARTPVQVSTYGSAIMLVFGIMGGSFIDLSMLPAFVRILSRITPNAWGLDGFTILGLGGTLADLGRPLLGLAVMGSLLFVLAVLLFSRRRDLVQ
ncbi:MAG: ABC transporter permease, partial [Chloroflexota bacterium]